ncbi:MAG: agmatinase [Bacteroidetes bacterium]|nr:MAG: agmatinase [Bacteroidota bacterium]
MTREEKIRQFDPNAVGLKNERFIGLPFEEEEARVVLLSVPWDVTVSYGEGTSTGPQNILEASSQLDLFDPDVEQAWHLGIYFRPPDEDWLARNDELRPKASAYIEFLEAGGLLEDGPLHARSLAEINRACEELRAYVYGQTRALLEAGKLPGIVGGEHSVPLGALQALGEAYPSFGVLQIDAHQDLRPAYEGFTYSHASIFYNALKIPSLKTLVQVGVRDHCEQEVELAARDDRIHLFTNAWMQEGLFQGRPFAELCTDILAPLPERVYVSFDIDGLEPILCPNTGTPVPGGLSFDQAAYLLRRVVDSGRRIIGFDLCEVAGLGNEWDGNVGARVLYKLCNLAGKSQGWVG